MIDLNRHYGIHEDRGDNAERINRAIQDAIDESDFLTLSPGIYHVEAPIVFGRFRGGEWVQTIVPSLVWPGVAGKNWRNNDCPTFAAMGPGGFPVIVYQRARAAELVGIKVDASLRGYSAIGVDYYGDQRTGTEWDVGSVGSSNLTFENCTVLRGDVGFDIGRGVTSQTDLISVVRCQVLDCNTGYAIAHSQCRVHINGGGIQGVKCAVSTIDTGAKTGSPPIVVGTTVSTCDTLVRVNTGSRAMVWRDSALEGIGSIGVVDGEGPHVSQHGLVIHDTTIQLVGNGPHLRGHGPVSIDGGRIDMKGLGPVVLHPSDRPAPIDWQTNTGRHGHSWRFRNVKFASSANLGLATIAVASGADGQWLHFENCHCRGPVNDVQRIVSLDGRPFGRSLPTGDFT